MASDRQKSAFPDTAPQPPGEVVRGFVSLALLIHGFLIFLAMSANIAPSDLQAALISKTRWHLQLLNFQLDYTPYHLTHADISDVDHRIEVLPDGGDENNDADWLVLPDAGWRGGERHKRYQRFAELATLFVEREEMTGLLTQSVAANMLHQQGIRPSQVRYRQHLLQNPEMVKSGTPEQRDPNSRLFFRTPYAANVLIFGEDQIQLVKKDAAAEVASPRSSTGSDGQPADSESN